MADEGLLAAATGDLQAGRLDDARTKFRALLDAAPEDPVVLHYLGLIAFQDHDGQSAVDYLGRAVAAPGATAEMESDFGVVLHRLGQTAEAEEHFDRALAGGPDDARFHYNLALLLRDLERLDEAVAHYQSAIELRGDFTEAHNNLGNIFKHLKRHEEAVACYERAITADAGFAPARKNLADAHEAVGDTGAAKDAYRAAISLGGNPGLSVRDALLLPVIPNSTDEIATWRARLEDGIDRLSEEGIAISDPLREVGATAFLLSYHGVANRHILEKLAGLYRSACPSLAYVAPHCESWRGPADDGRIRVGFVSSFFRDHTVAALNRGLIEGLPRDRFRVQVFSFAAPEDHVTEALRAAADDFVALPAKLDEARRRIAELRPDILYYTDIGMEPMTYFLAFSRLAPIQCASWGHPETSGNREIDYFISTGLAEPDGAEDHYTEELVRLDGLSVSIARAQVAGALPREHFGIAEDAKIFICPQALFKFHPDFDAMLARILGDDRRSELLLIHGNYRNWSSLLRARFEGSLGAAAGQVRFLPRLTGAQFLGLIAAADVMLDTPHFCGGRTTFDGLGMGTPVVTLPGEFLRGRVSQGIYKCLGMEDLIADSADAYVETALTLAADHAYNTDIRERIRDLSPRLFDGGQSAAELAAFFTQAIAAKI